MDVKIATQMCFPFIDECDSLPEEHDQWGKDHLRYMVEEIMKMPTANKDERTERLRKRMEDILLETDVQFRNGLVDEFFSEMNAIFKFNEKAMRWLGWLQCALSMGGGASLEEMKQINLKA